MSSERKFTVIRNEKELEDNFRKERIKTYQTNPLNIQGESLKEQFLKFRNGEAGRKFTVDDWLRSC